MTTPSRIRLDPELAARNRRRLHLREIVDAGPEEAKHTVGSELRAARVRAGMDLREVGDALRIRYRHLEALECGYFNELPGKTYAVGFVRAYAEHLGLNPDDLVRRFKSEVGDVTVAAASPLPEPVHEMGFPDPAEERTKLPTGITMIMASVLVIGVVAIWYLSHSPAQVAQSDVPPPPSFVENDAPLLRPHPSVPVGRSQSALAEPVDVSETRAAQLAQALEAAGETEEDAVGADDGDATASGTEAVEDDAAEASAVAARVDEDAVAASSDVVADEAPIRVTATALDAETILGAAEIGPRVPHMRDDDAVRRTAEAAQAAAQNDPAPSALDSLDMPALRTVSVDVDQPIQVAPDEDLVAEAGGSRIQVLALRSAWLRVDDGEGGVLVQRRLREGEIFAVPSRDGLMMAARNAGAFQILVDGRPIGRAGQDGEVLSGLSLDVWDLKQRELASGQ